MSREHFEQVGYWEWITVVRSLSLDSTTKLVALVLATYADNKTGRDTHPGVDLLMAGTGLRSDKTVRKALDYLRRVGLIERRFRGSSAGRRALADMYYLTLHNDLRVAAGKKPCDCDYEARQKKAQNDPWAGLSPVSGTPVLRTGDSPDHRYLVPNTGI